MPNILSLFININYKLNTIFKMKKKKATSDEEETSEGTKKTGQKRNRESSLKHMDTQFFLFQHIKSIHDFK